MLRPRRGIHSENHSEGDDSNKQVLKKCHTQKSVGITEDGQLGNEAGINDNINIKTKNLVNPDLSESEHFTSEDCGKNEKNQKSLSDVTWKLPKQCMVILFVVITTGILIYIWTYKYPEKTFEVKVQNQTQDEIDFDNELYGLEDIYKQQEERVWYTFAAGIKSVIAENPNKPSVFLLLYDNDLAENTVKCLCKDVTRAASKYLMKREIKPLMYAGSELNQEPILNDPGQLLVLYKDPVQRSGAMIITNLEDVRPKVAASFHFFCDRYTPLVEKAIYLFTLKLKTFPNAPLQKVAEDTLQSLWAKDLPEHIMYPLITRLTGNVLKIFSDHSNCFL